MSLCVLRMIRSPRPRARIRGSHTIGDHLKTIFDKTDTRTRGELSAKLFFGEHLPRIQDDTPLGDAASYIDAPRPRAGGDLGAQSLR